MHSLFLFHNRRFEKFYSFRFVKVKIQNLISEDSAFQSGSGSGKSCGYPNLTQRYMQSRSCSTPVMYHQNITPCSPPFNFIILFIVVGFD